jgi:hypothetical protein
VLSLPGTRAFTQARQDFVSHQDTLLSAASRGIVLLRYLTVEQLNDRPLILTHPRETLTPEAIQRDKMPECIFHMTLRPFMMLSCALV